MATHLNIIDTAILLGSFSTFVRLVEGSSLETKLRSQKNLTVFAPADLAFRDLSGPTLAWLLESRNEPMLSSILHYHVVRGLLATRDLRNVQWLTTEQGQELQIDERENILVNSAKVIECDIEATNGIIHAIDHLLMPRVAVAGSAL